MALFSRMQHKRFHNRRNHLTVTVKVKNFEPDKNRLIKRRSKGLRLLNDDRVLHFPIDLEDGDNTAVLLLSPEEAQRIFNALGAYLDYVQEHTGGLS